VLPADRKLRVWIPGTERARLSSIATSSVVAEGTRYETVIPEGAAELEIAGERWRWKLALSNEAPSPILERAEKLRAAGKMDESVGMLQLDALPTAVRCRALGLIARVDLQRGRFDAATSHFEEARAIAEKTGQTSEIVRNGHAMAFAMIRQGRFTEARALLEEVAPRSDPENAAANDYYLGLLAFHTGDLRAALRSFDRAELGARRLRMGSHLMSLAIARANVLVALGRTEEAVRVLSKLSASASCDRALILTNLGWQTLLLHHDQEAESNLIEALSLYETDCPNTARAGNVLINLALLALTRSDPRRASHFLEQARRIMPKPDLRVLLYGNDIEAQLALHAKDHKRALEIYDELLDLADASLHLEIRWSALVGRGRAFEAQRRFELAAEAYLRAEQALDRQYLLIPVDAGRGSFLATHDESSKRLIDLLVRLDRAAHALKAVRRARSRVLSSLVRSDRVAGLPKEIRAKWESAIARYAEERQALEQEVADDWKLADSRLVERRREREARKQRLQSAIDDAFALLPAQEADFDLPPKGELLLAYAPATNGWIGFAAIDGAVRAKRLASIDAANLLEPFRAEIDRAQSIRVMTYGALRDVDFHALRYRDDVLLAKAPIQYAIDLPDRSFAHGDLALVVADPRSDLASAQAEAKIVVGLLERERRWRVSLLSGEAATRSAVLSGLSEARLFHYAGHGELKGRAGWDSGLPLAQSQTLQIADLFTLPRVPEIAILSGCETARDADRSALPGLGIGQAFLAAGSAIVVAAMRPIEDDLAADLSRALYENPDEPPARALQRAQLALRERHPRADWAAFRSLVRD
jgi:cellulose synthase operon protein C